MDPLGLVEMVFCVLDEFREECFLLFTETNTACINMLRLHICRVSDWLMSGTAETDYLQKSNSSIYRMTFYAQSKQMAVT